MVLALTHLASGFHEEGVFALDEKLGFMGRILLSGFVWLTFRLVFVASALLRALYPHSPPRGQV